MTKRIIGLMFILVASFQTTYSIYQIWINPNSLLTLKKIFSGDLGIQWTLGIVLFYGSYFLMIFILFLFGIKWIKPSKIN